MKTINDLAVLELNIIKEYMDDIEIDTAIDITLGNGYDTEKIVDFVKDKIYAFDIQEEAIKYSKKRFSKVLSEEQISKIEFINETHENVDKYCDKAQLIMGNMGYLPNFDHEIKTLPYTSLICLNKCIDILDYRGIMLITSYLGHDRGKEHETLESFFKSLDSKKFKVLCVNPLNQSEMSPKLFVCQKQ